VAGGCICASARSADIGCCDNSPGKHATAHFGETSHPIIRWAEPGEDCSWCYADEIAFEVG